MMPPGRNIVSVLLGWIVTLSIPVALIGTSLRLILLPGYLAIEYRMPGFPADPYGFDIEDRLQWATHAWQYLVMRTEPAYLADLEFQDGSEVFGTREVDHMADVKAVVGAALTAWLTAMALIAVAGLATWRLRDGGAFRLGLRRGGWLTIGLSAFIGTIITVGILVDPNVFWEFFTVFHGLFFEGDTWLFAYSDTLIRLFPIRFWQDTFLFAALMVLGGGLLLALAVRDAPSREPT